MSLLTKGVGQLIIEAVTLDASDPLCLTTINVDWTDLGETYQLERSVEAVNWSTVYTGIAIHFTDTVANIDSYYYYRVKVVGETVYSNVDSVLVYQQNAYLRDDGCWRGFNVSPYDVRRAYRLNCGETYTYTVDEARCKSKDIACGGTSPNTHYDLNGFPGTITWSTTFSFTCPDAVGKSGVCNGASPASWVATDFWEPSTPVTVTLASATFSGESATFTYSATGAGTRGRANWKNFSFSSLTAS